MLRYIHLSFDLSKRTTGKICYDIIICGMRKKLQGSISLRFHHYHSLHLNACQQFFRRHIFPHSRSDCCACSCVYVLVCTGRFRFSLLCLFPLSYFHLSTDSFRCNDSSVLHNLGLRVFSRGGLYTNAAAT